MSETDRMEFWNESWEKGHIGFHKSEVHRMLPKHFDKLYVNDSKPAKIFVPLCGKTLDMKWLADQGVETVGLDGVQSALEQFFTEQNLSWEQEPSPALGSQGSLLKTKDGKIRLYCGDIMNLSPDIAGMFDAVWDRASIVAINREDLNRYAEVMKRLVKPGGRILMELLLYDLSILKGIDVPNTIPPPHPMTEEDIKVLYEPEFSVQFLDTAAMKFFGNEISANIFLLVKK